MQRLVADVRQRRGTDTVVAFQPASSSWPVELAAVDRFAEQVGLSGIGELWREINRSEAVSLAAAVLARDLAYSVPLMSDIEARELAERFAGVFAPDARFFTNTDDRIGTQARGWMPLTKSTFDVGVLGVDARTIGVLVVRDED